MDKVDIYMTYHREENPLMKIREKHSSQAEGLTFSAYCPFAASRQEALEGVVSIVHAQAHCLINKKEPQIKNQFLLGKALKYAKKLVKTCKNIGEFLKSDNFDDFFRIHYHTEGAAA
jgi:hypothetical protein